MNGFSIGIAVIIGTSRIADVLGLRLDHAPTGFFEKLPVIWRALDGISGPAAVVALPTMALIVVLRRMAPKLPGLIVAVDAGRYDGLAVRGLA